jgi:hypothetical protein
MRILSRGQVQTRFHQEDGKTIFERVQDCTPIVERTKKLHNEGIHGSNDFRHAARVPKVIVEKYLNDNGITFREFCQNDEHMGRLLNDPAIAHFRIWKGRI